MRALLMATVCVFALAGCMASSPSREVSPAHEPEPDEADDVTTARSGVTFVEIAESFLTRATPDDNIDSPASWRAPDGATWLIATAKAGDGLRVYDGDDGRVLRSIGRSGGEDGEFRRPNGIFVVDDLVFVVERDNHRVQVLRLPAFESLGSFGSDELHLPYGIWLRPSAKGYEVFVTDAYMSDADDDVPPPLAELNARVQRYHVALAGTRIDATSLGAFGDITAAGAIRIPESLWGDPEHDRLLIAEEDQATGTRLREYTFAYRYAGRDIGATQFHAQAEGIALWRCADGSGYWIATDQYKDRSVFHVYDRETLAYRGAFAGRVANTDGVWLQQAPTRAFPHGVFYAVDDDQAVGAFDWRRIAGALRLRESCASR
jgi:3-phytase